MSNLEEVNFYKNYIAQVPDGTFAKNKKLYSVDFHDNQISNITEKAFPETFENDYDGVLHKLDLTLNNIKVVDPAVMKKSDTAINKFYPQKNAMNLELKEDNGQKISWSQDLSVLDLAFWFDKTASDEAREIETVEDYKDMLEQNGWKDKNIVEVMDEKYDWDIITEVQKKNADGTWETVKEDTETDQAEELKGNFSVSNLGTYRIKKVLNATLNGTKQYRFTAVSYTHLVFSIIPFGKNIKASQTNNNAKQLNTPEQMAAVMREKANNNIARMKGKITQSQVNATIKQKLIVKTKDEIENTYGANSVYYYLSLIHISIQYYEESLELCKQHGKASTDLMKLYNKKRQEAAEAKDDEKVKEYMDKVQNLMQMSKDMIRGNA